MGESFENLKVWQKAHEIMLFVHHEVVPLLPKEEKWNLAGEAQRLLNGYIDYLKREKPGIDIIIDHGRINIDDDDSPPDL